MPPSSDEMATRPDLSDEELLLRFRDRGDQSAFDALVSRYERELYGYLRRYVGDATVAEDLFQATFLQVYQKAHQFKPGRRVRPWLYSIATNQAIDWLRKAGREATTSLDTRERGDEGDSTRLLDLLETPSPTPLAEAEARERDALVRRAVEQLSPELRATAVLVFFQGLKYSEVAEILGIPIGTVKSRIHAALIRMGEAWRRQSQQG